MNRANEVTNIFLDSESWSTMTLIDIYLVQISAHRGETLVHWIAGRNSLLKPLCTRVVYNHLCCYVSHRSKHSLTTYLHNTSEIEVMSNPAHMLLACPSYPRNTYTLVYLPSLLCIACSDTPLIPSIIFRPPIPPPLSRCMPFLPSLDTFKSSPTWALMQ